DRLARARLQGDGGGCFGEVDRQEGFLTGVLVVALLDGGQFLLVVAPHLRFEPLVDFGAMEAPLPADLLSGKIRAAGPLAHLARVALQVSGQLLKAHHFVAHDPPPLLREHPKLVGCNSGAWITAILWGGWRGRRLSSLRAALLVVSAR